MLLLYYLICLETLEQFGRNIFLKETSGKLGVDKINLEIAFEIGDKVN